MFPPPYNQQLYKNLSHFLRQFFTKQKFYSINPGAEIQISTDFNSADNHA